MSALLGRTQCHCLECHYARKILFPFLPTLVFFLLQFGLFPPHWLNWLSVRKIEIYPPYPENQVFITNFNKYIYKLNTNGWKLWRGFQWWLQCHTISSALQLQNVFSVWEVLSDQLSSSPQGWDVVMSPESSFPCLSVQMGRAKGLHVNSASENTCYCQNSILRLPFIIQLHIENYTFLKGKKLTGTDETKSLRLSEDLWFNVLCAFWLLASKVLKNALVAKTLFFLLFLILRVQRIK